MTEGNETRGRDAETSAGGKSGLSRRRALMALGAVPVAGAVAGTAAWSDAHSLPAPGGNRVMNIVAHEDDDLLFLSPDLLHDIHAGKTGKPTITEIFMRLPDGNPDGSGAEVHHHQIPAGQAAAGWDWPKRSPSASARTWPPTTTSSASTPAAWAPRSRP